MKEFPRGTIDKIFRELLMQQNGNVDRSTASAKIKLYTAMQEFALEATKRIKDIIEVQKMITAKKPAVDLAFKMSITITPLISDNPKIRLQKAIIKTMIKEQGVKCVSDDGAILFGQFLLGYINKIVLQACEVAEHAKRKTIKESDIDFALKHL